MSAAPGRPAQARTAGDATGAPVGSVGPALATRAASAASAAAAAAAAAAAEAEAAAAPAAPAAPAASAAAAAEPEAEAAAAPAAPAPAAPAALPAGAAEAAPATGFSRDWLALREPFDRAARGEAAGGLDWPACAAYLQGRAAGAPLTVVDLGCGTGASLRALALRLGGRQHWRLVDHDAALLAAVPGALAAWAQAEGLQVAADGTLSGRGLQLQVECCQADLAAGLDGLPLDGAMLVTASALMDLVSARWLQALVARCHAAGAAVCWALNVDDRLVWAPADPNDAAVHAAFRAHQQGDKGFGPALGGGAVACAADALGACGYTVRLAQSDWRIGAHDTAMLRAMVQGVGDAAVEQVPHDVVRVRGWQARRLAQPAIAHGTAALLVGHVDLLAWPA